MDALANTTSMHSSTSLTSLYVTPEVEYENSDLFTVTWCIFPRTDDKEANKEDTQVFLAPLVEEALDLYLNGKYQGPPSLQLVFIMHSFLDLL